MARKRTIPFGYCMKSGEITTEPQEMYAVVKIFSEYLSGKSLSQIAKLMISEKIRYNAGFDKWNKNMVKRIIENEKYLGKDKYPQIINEEAFRKANEKRLQKATSLNLIQEDLQAIRNVTYCAECGRRLTRIGGNSKYEHWDYRNPDCYRLEYRLTDQMIMGAVLNVLNSAIAHLSLLEVDGQVSNYSPNTEIICKQNEINRMIDSPQINFEKIKSEIFWLAQMKYDCCTYSDKPQKTEQLKSLLKNHQQLNVLDIGLFKSCVSRIRISHFYTIEVELINGVKIKNIEDKTSRMKSHEHSSKCNGNSCKDTNN